MCGVVSSKALPEVESALACLGLIGENGDSQAVSLFLYFVRGWHLRLSETTQGGFRWSSTHAVLGVASACLFKWTLRTFSGKWLEQPDLSDLVSLSFGVRRISNGGGSVVRVCSVRRW